MLTAYSQRVVRGTAATLSWQQVGADGEPANPGTVTVTVARADGTVLATDAATGGATTAPRTYALTQAQTAALDRLTVTWKVAGATVAVTEVDVTAAPWFSNAELRAAHPELGSDSTYPAIKITPARLEVEAFFEQITHVRFVPGYQYETLPGTWRQSMTLPRPYLRTVRSVGLYGSVSDTVAETFDATQLAAIPANEAGVAWRADGGTWSAPWVRIGWEHGLIAPPADVKAQAMLLCRHLLIARQKSNYPDNATSITNTELGWAAILVTPGVRGAHTSVPSVNDCLDRHTFELVGVA